MITDELKTKIFESLGAASTCWIQQGNERIFDSTRCEFIGNNLVDAINSEIETEKQILFDSIVFPKPSPMMLERVSSPKISEMKIVCKFTIEKFNTEVARMLENGFVPYGSLTITMNQDGYVIAILMVKYE